MTEFDFLLSDRIQKIKSINDEYNLADNAYISFSGGKDSVVLSKLIDIALPNNNIPRVFINTGIEYGSIVKFVKEFGRGDNRLSIVSTGKNIKQLLEEKGYPFKSKEHSEKVSIYQSIGKTEYIKKYLGESSRKNFLCPEKLKYQFTPEFNIKVSKKCCNELKKKPAEKWAKENKKSISITGIRKEEGGSRMATSVCTVFYDKNCEQLKKFHPLLVCSNEWINLFIKKYNISLCELYYPPYNFNRTGCKGCPYALYLQRDLDIMEKFFPQERRQCEFIWGKIYDEYRRIGYRLKPNKQPELF